VGFAVSIGVLGVAAGVAAAVVTQVYDSWAYPAHARVPLGVAIAVAYAGAGAVVAIRKPANGVGWLMLGIGAWAGLGALLTALTGASASPGEYSVTMLMPIQLWWWAPPVWAVATVLPMIYPDGRLTGRWRWPVLFSLLGMATYSVGLATSEPAFIGRHPVPNPLARPEWQDFANFCLRAGQYVLLAAVGVAAAGLMVRWRRASGLRRRQVGVALAVFLLGAAQALVRLGLAQPLPVVLDRATEVLAYGLFAVTIGVALTRQRLFDLDVVLRRTLVGIAVTATVLACYVGAITVLATVLPAGVVPGSVLATGLAGAAIFPVALVVTRWIRRITWGRKIDVVEIATGLGQRMRNRLEVAEIPAAVCEEIVTALRLRMARLELRSAEGTRLLAQIGSVPRPRVEGESHGEGREATFDLWYRGEKVGRLAVSPPDGQPHLEETVAQALSSLADQVAPVVAALRLDEQLLHTREQLVTAREEERSRLSRELHDNVGPTLAGIRLQLDSVRGRLPADFTGTDLLDRAVQGIQDALVTLRRVVHDLRPPELDALGLSGAIRELATFLSGPTLRVETTLPEDVSTLSKPVEVAAYRIVAEALTNVVRHAEASRAEIVMQIVDGRLVVQVRDDGIGVRPNTNRHGLGLRFMAQRAAEVAGDFSYRGDDAGTTVRATFPAAP
jgi:signal transduction histidine kinase